MRAKGEKTLENKRRTLDNGPTTGGMGINAPFQLQDNRPEAMNQQKMQEIANEYTGSLENPIQQKNIFASPLNQITPIQLLKNSEITAKAGVNGISKQNVIYLRSHRPQYAPGQVETVWNNAKDINGRVFCPNTNIELFWNGSWDMGHRAGHEYKKLWEALATCQINYNQFLQIYQDPANYHPEDPSANRSHMHEED